MSEVFEAVKRARARAQAATQSSNAGASPAVAKPDEKSMELQQWVTKIENDLQGFGDLIFILGIEGHLGKSTELVAGNFALVPLVALSYRDGLTVEDYVARFGLTGQSPKPVCRHEKTASAVRALIDEMRNREGIGFTLLWTVGGQGDAHLDHSADYSERDAYESVAHMIHDELSLQLNVVL